MNAYLSVFRMRWKMELQYRGAVVGGVICQMFFGLILIALYRALYAGKPQTMPFSSVATYVWLQQAFFRMMLASDGDLLDKIRTGNIAYDLCRPMRLYGFYYARIAAQKLLGSLLRAAPMLVFAALCPRVMVLGHGSKLYDGALPELLSRYDTQRVMTLRYDGDVDFPILPEGCEVSREGAAYRVVYDHVKIPTAHIMSLLRSAGPIREWTAQPQNVDHLIAAMYREMDL